MINGNPHPRIGVTPSPPCVVTTDAAREGPPRVTKCTPSTPQGSLRVTKCTPSDPSSEKLPCLPRRTQIRTPPQPRGAAARMRIADGATRIG